MARGAKLLIVTLDDGSGRLEAHFQASIFLANTERLRENELLILTGVVRNDDFSGGLRMHVEEIVDF
jgi:DNA polymerase-3 subunit alpha